MKKPLSLLTATVIAGVNASPAAGPTIPQRPPPETYEKLTEDWPFALATPVALLSPVVVTGFMSFGLMALLYLVTEELLVEAHEKPDTPFISAMFFVGFLGLLLLEEVMA